MPYTPSTTMNDRWLESENMRLRAPEPEDLELLYCMENDTESVSFSMQ